MEWWRQPFGIDPVESREARTRDYFRIEDEAGLRFWVYRDGLYDRDRDPQTGLPVQPSWFMHGLFA